MNTRTQKLTIGFGVVLSLFLGLQVGNIQSREPRLVFENRLPEAIDGLQAEDTSRTFDFGRVPENGTTILPIAARVAESYTILGCVLSGDELIRQLEITRDERRDVHIRVHRNGEGFRYVTIEGSLLPLIP